VTALPPEVLSASILDAVRSPKLFKPWFRDPQTWASWFAFLRVLFGLPIAEHERQLFQECTGRAEPRPGGYLEAWLCCGRRGGKSFILALVAVFLATCREWSPYLAPGERGTIVIVAADRKQARTIYRYARALLQVAPLKALVVRDVAEVIDLSNGISLEILTASFRTIRGYSVVAALLDEIAFWKSDLSTAPDTEVVNALRPSMATVPGSMLLAASSPYARRGVLWRQYQRHYGKDSATLVWQAPTRTMNPSVPQSVVDEAMEDDQASASAEFMAQFRVDIETYITREVVEACTVLGRHELPYIAHTGYAAFCDLAGGGGSDSMTLAIGHYEEKAKVAIIDVLREVKPPCSPSETIEEFSQLLKAYQLRRVEGDRYAGEWPREQFREHGVTYDPAERTKSDLYREALPSLMAHRVELPDMPRLMSQIVGLERRVARGGRDSIDHAPNGHDDLANAALGLVAKLVGRGDPLAIWRKLGEAA
jgi:hypothetical protein